MSTFTPAHPGARKITPEDPPVFPCWLWKSKPVMSKEPMWLHFYSHTQGPSWAKTVQDLIEGGSYTHWSPDGPRPEGPPEGEALNRPPIGSVVKVAGLSDWPIKVTAHTERGFAYSGGKPFDIPRLGIWGDGTGEVYLDGPDVSWSFFHLPAPATEPPATRATPETAAAWEAAPPADHGGMTAMRRCSESLETRLHAAEAEVRRLKEFLPRVAQSQRDGWAEARLFQQERDEARAQLQTALAAQQKAEGEIESLTLQLQKAEAHSDHALSELVMKHAATIARLTEEVEHERACTVALGRSYDQARAKLALADGLAEALEKLREACKDVLLPVVNEAIKRGYKMEMWTPEQFQWSQAVELTDAALTAYRAASVPPAATGTKGVAS